MPKDTLTYRVSKLEETSKEIESDVKKIMTNHLPHIQIELQQIRAEIKINSWKIASITAIGSAVLSMAGNYFLNK